MMVECGVDGINVIPSTLHLPYRQRCLADTQQQGENTVGKLVIYVDDLTGVQADNLRTAVPFTFDGEEGELDLTPTTYDALMALLVDHDPDGMRMVFAAETTVSARTRAQRSKADMDRMRAAAREAVDVNGEPLFDVKDSGRLSNDVVTWFENVYLPSQEPVTGESDSDVSVPETDTANTETETVQDVQEDSVDDSPVEKPARRARK